MNPDQFNCTHCQNQLTESPRQKGALLACPGCNQLFYLPDSPGSAPQIYTPTRHHPGKLPRSYRPLPPRPKMVLLIGLIGILVSLLGTLAFATTTLLIANGSLEKIDPQFQQSLDQENITNSQIITISAILTCCCALFLIVNIALIKRKEFARKVFRFYAWFILIFAALGSAGTLLYPDQPQNNLESIIFITPGLFYLIFSLFYLRREKIIATFR